MICFLLGRWDLKMRQSWEDPGYQVPQILSSPTGDGDAKWRLRHRSCQTYCWGFCGTDATVARLLAASLAFPEASFTESLSSHWCVSPASTDKDTHGTSAQCPGHSWCQKQHHSNRSDQKKDQKKALWCQMLGLFFDRRSHNDCRFVMTVRVSFFWTQCYY